MFPFCCHWIIHAALFVPSYQHVVLLPCRAVVVLCDVGYDSFITAIVLNSDN